jgi:hypothetical protein
MTAGHEIDTRRGKRGGQQPVACAEAVFASDA